MRKKCYGQKVPFSAHEIKGTGELFRQPAKMLCNLRWTHILSSGGNKTAVALMLWNHGLCAFFFGKWYLKSVAKRNQRGNI